MWQLIPILASAALQARSNQQKADQQRRYNQGQAEVTRYSPWTHMQGQLDTSYAPDAVSGAVSGGIQGLGMAAALGDAGLFGSSKPGPNMDYYNEIKGMQNTPQPMTKPASFWNTIRTA